MLWPRGRDAVAARAGRGGRALYVPHPAHLSSAPLRYHGCGRRAAGARGQQAMTCLPRAVAGLGTARASAACRSASSNGCGRGGHVGCSSGNYSMQGSASRFLRQDTALAIAAVNVRMDREGMGG